MKKFKKYIVCSLVFLMTITTKVFASEDTQVIEKIEPPIFQDGRITDLLTPEKEPPKPEIRFKIIEKEVPKIIIKEKTSTVTKEDNEPKKEVVEENETVIEKVKEKDKHQYITFKADNGRLYYLVNTIDKDGYKTTKIYSEMNDEKLQNLSEGKSQEEINRERRLKAEEEQLEKEKAELEALKNQKPVEKKKKSNVGTIILVVLAVGGVIGYRKFKDNNRNADNEYEDNDNSINNEDYLDDEYYDDYVNSEEDENSMTNGYSAFEDEKADNQENVEEEIQDLSVEDYQHEEEQDDEEN